MYVAAFLTIVVLDATFCRNRRVYFKFATRDQAPLEQGGCEEGEGGGVCLGGAGLFFRFEIGALINIQNS